MTTNDYKRMLFFASKSSLLCLIRNNLSKIYLVFCSFFFNLCVKEVQYEKTEHTFVLYCTKVQSHFFLNNIEIKIWSGKGGIGPQRGGRP